MTESEATAPQILAIGIVCIAAYTWPFWMFGLGWLLFHRCSQ